MKTKEAVSTKKQRVALKDLKTKKNPKGGFVKVSFSINNDSDASIASVGTGGKVTAVKDGRH